MIEFYEGYVECNGKAARKPYKREDPNRQLISLEEARQLDSYGGVLSKDVMIIDADTVEEAEKILDGVEGENLNCRVLQTDKGAHFYFRLDKRWEGCQTGFANVCGFEKLDKKTGNTNCYGIIKLNGKERPILWEEDPDLPLDPPPPWLLPDTFVTEVLGGKGSSLMKMGEGEGRNDTLFRLIGHLAKIGVSKPDVDRIIRYIGTYLFADPVPENELNLLLRNSSYDGAVQSGSFRYNQSKAEEGIFFEKNRFRFDYFAQYIISQYECRRIGGKLQIYDENSGVYKCGDVEIERKMIEELPRLSSSQRNECRQYMDLLIDEPTQLADARYIAFSDCLYDIVDGACLDYSPEIILTNKLAVPYNPEAYDELVDKTLDKLACGDKEIRALLEECIGYCMYRRNELGKAFILTGPKANGKSTFLDMIKNMLGVDNVTALDLAEISERFSTSMLFGKLANIGDDIGDEFINASGTAQFKKIVTGNAIKAEDKGERPYIFEPYVKLLFSANNIPRMKDGTGAVLRRLVIIPFKATFSKADPDYDPYIKYKLIEPGALEYLALIGLKGLKRVLAANEFTQSNQVDKELRDYELETNPFAAFIDCSPIKIENEPVDQVLNEFRAWCSLNGHQKYGRGAAMRGIAGAAGLRTERHDDGYYFVER